MSLATAPTPAVWLCSRCGYKPFTGGIASRAKHLIDDHGVPAMAALAEARGEAEAPPPPAADIAPAPPTTTKEAPMPTGVYARTSDPTKLCGRCKRPKDAHRPGCPKDTSATTGGGARTKPPKPATGKRRGRPKKVAVAPRVAPTHFADPIVTIRGALEQLEAERTELASMRALKAELTRVFGG